MKIKTRLIILFLLISLVPLVIMSGFVVNTARLSLKATIGKDIEDLAREKARAMAMIIKERINEAKVLSEMLRLKSAVKEKNLSYAGKTDAEVLKAILDIDKEWIELKGKTDTANGIMNSNLSRFLGEYQAKNRERYGEIFVTDLKGATVGMTKILSDYYQADEEWWESSLDGGKGKTFIDDRGFDDSIGAIAMGIVVPVRDDGEVIGILKINYKVRSIIDIVVATGAKESGIMGKLANSMERVLAHTSGEEYEELSDEERAILKKKEHGWIEDAHGGKKTLMGYSPVDTEIHTRVPSPGEIKGVSGEKWEPTTWFMFIDIEQERGFAPIDRLVKFIFILGIAISVLVVALALYFAKTISDPILKLTKGTETIGTGNLDYKIGTDAKDEIGALSRSFDTMTDRLITTTASRDELRRAEEALRKANHELQLLSSLDGLTGIANRRSFDEFIDREWRRSLREEKPLSLIMVDIDYFKKFNDEYGHQAGDDCLKKVAETLSDKVHRPSDLVARYGGEEFVLVLGKTDAKDAQLLAEKLCSSIEAMKVPHAMSDVADVVTLSMGVSCLTPSSDSSPEKLIKLADEALFRAKKEGRNRVERSK